MVKETETETAEAKAPRKPVAEHVLLDAAGNEAESEEKAHGIGYKLLENGKTFTWQWTQANESERLMLAIFGAKTLATNVTSAARNSQKLDADGQFEELAERFALIRAGQWLDRTREPGAPRVNRDALAQAICEVLVGTGKRTAADIGTAGSGGEYDRTRARLDTEADFMAKARTVPQVADAYNAIVGRKVATVDDLLS